jgi:hypothetical protein
MKEETQDKLELAGLITMFVLSLIGLTPNVYGGPYTH